MKPSCLLATMLAALQLAMVPSFSQQPAADPAAMRIEQGQKNAAQVHAQLLLGRALSVVYSGRTITDIAVSGVATQPSGFEDAENGTFTAKGLSTGEFRLDVEFPSGSQSEIRAPSDKGPVGASVGADGKVHSLMQHNLATEPAWLFPTLFLHKMGSDSRFAVEHIGSEALRGKTSEHLRATRQFTEMTSDVAPFMQNLSRSELYLDSETLLPSALYFNTHSDFDALREFPVEIHYSDYHIVNGVQVPHHIQKYFRGDLVLDLQIKSISVNSGVSPSAFVLPS